MKIAFRHVPFTPAQRAELDEMARAGGYETLWYADGATPQAEELKDCEVLMGYFPPALLPELPALKWLQTPAAGVDKLCGNIFARDDAVLTNCSGAFGVAIAEYMVTGILMLMRLMPEYASNQQHHVWKCMEKLPVHLWQHDHGGWHGRHRLPVCACGKGHGRHRARRAPHIGKEACGL